MLEQIKEQLAQESKERTIRKDNPYPSIHYFGYLEGFEDCMNLELPIKFAEWKQNNFYDGKQINGVWHYTKSMYLNPEWKTLKQLFNYWIENVYNKEI